MIEREKIYSDKQLKVIYTGVDNLDFSVKGMVHPKFIEALKQAKEKAQQNSCDIPLEFAGVKGMVKPNGASGGYAFIFTNEMYGLTIKEKPSTEDAPVRVSIRSILLSNRGFKGACSDVMDSLDKLMHTIKDTVVGRVDICVDVQAPRFKLDPMKFIASGHTTKKTNWEFSAFGRSEYETLTIGKMPNVQCCIYNKSKQVTKQDKAIFWHSVWGNCHQYDPTQKGVWRFEMRFGREYLRKRSIHTFEDVEGALPKMLSVVMRKTIKMVDKRCANLSRDSQVSEIWDTVTRAILSYVENLCSDIRDGMPMMQRYQAILERKEKRFKANHVGTLISMLALNGNTLDFDELEKMSIRAIREAKEHEANVKRLDKSLHIKTKEIEHLWGGVA